MVTYVLKARIPDPVSQLLNCIDVYKMGAADRNFHLEGEKETGNHKTAPSEVEEKLFLSLSDPF